MNKPAIDIPSHAHAPIGNINTEWNDVNDAGTQCKNMVVYSYGLERSSPGTVMVLLYLPNLYC